jgi:hypothetical protein
LETMSVMPRATWHGLFPVRSTRRSCLLIWAPFRRGCLWFQRQIGRYTAVGLRQRHFRRHRGGRGRCHSPWGSILSPRRITSRSARSTPFLPGMHNIHRRVLLESLTSAHMLQRSNAFLQVLPKVSAMGDDYGPHLAHHLATNKLQHWEQVRLGRPPSAVHLQGDGLTLCLPILA